MPLLNQRRQAAAELSVPSPASNHSEELEIGHELQSVQELQSMLASLELQPEPERENPSGSGSAEQPSNESHEQRQEEAAEPWLLPQFQTIQRSSKDQWNFTLWDRVAPSENIESIEFVLSIQFIHPHLLTAQSWIVRESLEKFAHEKK